MKRISKEVQAAADAHIEARRSGKWNPCEVNSMEELKAKILEGHTFEQVMDRMETQFCSVHSILAMGLLSVDGGEYKKNIYKGFKTWLQ